MLARERVAIIGAGPQRPGVRLLPGVGGARNHHVREAAARGRVGRQVRRQIVVYLPSLG
jgi:hypothetical protein